MPSTHTPRAEHTPSTCERRLREFIWRGVRQITLEDHDTLVLTHHHGAGHFYPLPAPLDLLHPHEWAQIMTDLMNSPGHRYQIHGHTDSASPHEALVHLRAHAFARAHDYPTIERLTGHMINAAGAATPIMALPGPLPSLAAFTQHTYPARSWSWVPPSLYPLVTVEVGHNPHT